MSNPNPNLISILTLTPILLSNPNPTHHLGTRGFNPNSQIPMRPLVRHFESHVATQLHHVEFINSHAPLRPRSAILNPMLLRNSAMLN